VLCVGLFEGGLCAFGQGGRILSDSKVYKPQTPNPNLNTQSQPQPQTDELLDEPPHSASEPLVPPTVIKHILGQAALQLALLATVLGPVGDELAGGDAGVQRTLLFNMFVWLQLFNQVCVFVACVRACGWVGGFGGVWV